MNVAFNGIKESIVTFISPEKINPGDIVTIYDNNTVKKSTADSSFIGVCKNYQNGLAGVQISGFMTVKVKSLINIQYGRQYFISDDDAAIKVCDPTTKGALPLNVISINKDDSTIDAFLSI